MEKKWWKWASRVTLIGVILANIKNIFTNFDVDPEYAIAMSWRMVRGDHMISQMWEPHQTSAFLSTFFMWLYYALTGSTTGIAVYLNVVGVLIKAGVTFFLYCTFRRYLSKHILFLMCMFYFAVNPKDILMPEFSNMQLWFSTLLLCCLFRYFQNQEKKVWLLLAGACICLEILSYPSCVIVFVAVLFLLFVYTDKKWANMLILSGECMLGGGIYLISFISRMGIADFLECLGEIMSGDASHAIAHNSQAAIYLRNLGQMLFMIALCAVISLIAGKIYSLWIAFRKGTKVIAKSWYITCFFVLFLAQDFLSTLFVQDRYLHLTVYIPILLVAFIAQKYCNESEKQIYVSGTIISLCSFVATLLLTNLTLFTTMAYLILGIMVAFIPLEKIGGGRARNYCCCFAW